MNTSDQPATPSADEEIKTPLCNALGIDEWTLPDNRLVVSIRWKDLARQLERDIIKIARCFAEATSQLASLQSERDRLTDACNKEFASAQELSGENMQLRAALAEIEKLEAQCNLLAESVQGENNAHMKALRAGQVAEETITDLRSQLQAATTERLALEAQVGELRGFVKETHDVMPSPESTKLLTPQPDLPLIEEVRDYLEDAKTYANTFTLRQRADQLLARLNPAK